MCKHPALRRGRFSMGTLHWDTFAAQFLGIVISLNALQMYTCVAIPRLPVTRELFG